MPMSSMLDTELLSTTTAVRFAPWSPMKLDDPAVPPLCHTMSLSRDRRMCQLSPMRSCASIRWRGARAPASARSRCPFSWPRLAAANLSMSVIEERSAPAPCEGRNIPGGDDLPALVVHEHEVALPGRRERDVDPRGSRRETGSPGFTSPRCTASASSDPVNTFVIEPISKTRLGPSRSPAPASPYAKTRVVPSGRTTQATRPVLRPLSTSSRTMRSSLASVLSAAGAAGRVVAAVPLSPSSPQPATAVAEAIV